MGYNEVEKKVKKMMENILLSAFRYGSYSIGHFEV